MLGKNTHLLLGTLKLWMGNVGRKCERWWRTDPFFFNTSHHRDVVSNTAPYQHQWTAWQTLTTTGVRQCQAHCGVVVQGDNHQYSTHFPWLRHLDSNLLFFSPNTFIISVGTMVSSHRLFLFPFPNLILSSLYAPEIKPFFSALLMTRHWCRTIN